MKQRLFILLSSLIILLAYQSAFAQNSNITQGLSYLNITQNLDGSLGNITSTTDITRTTIAVMDTLQALSQTNTSLYGNAFIRLCDLYACF